MGFGGKQPCHPCAGLSAGWDLWLRRVSHGFRCASPPAYCPAPLWGFTCRGFTCRGAACRGATCRGATCRGATRRCAGLASSCGGVVPSGLGGSSHVIPALACAMAGIYGCGVLFLRAQKYKETVYTDMEGRISTIILLSPSFQFGHQAWNRND